MKKSVMVLQFNLHYLKHKNQYKTCNNCWTRNTHITFGKIVIKNEKKKHQLSNHKGVNLYETKIMWYFYDVIVLNFVNTPTEQKEWIL